MKQEIRVSDDYIRESFLYEMNKNSEIIKTDLKAIKINPSVKNNCTPVKKYTSEEARDIILNKYNSSLARFFIKFTFRHKTLFKSIPIVGKYLINKKNGYIGDSEANSVIDSIVNDLNNNIGLNYKEFISFIYRLLLDREIEEPAKEEYKRLYIKGASNRVLTYMVYTSEEFSKKYQIPQIERYKKDYNKFIIRNKIKRIPFVYSIWYVMTLYDKQMETKCIQQSLLEKIDYNAHLINNNIALEMENKRILQLLVEKMDYNSHLISNNIALEIDNTSRYLSDLMREWMESEVALIDKITKDTSNQELYDSINRNSHVLFQKLKSLVGDSNDKILSIINDNSSYDRETDRLARDYSNAMLATINKKLDISKPIVYSQQGGIIAVTMGKYILGLPSEEWMLAMYIDKNGFIEYETEVFFKRIVDDGMVVVDVGANVGVYTLHAANQNCTVYSYEPTPNTYRILNNNIKVNGFYESRNINSYNLAVGETEKDVELNIVSGICGHNTIYNIKNSYSKVDVKMVSLDNHIGNNAKVDIVKIDVEGAELLVLEGMKGIIKNNPDIKIIMEFSPDIIKNTEYTPFEVFEKIKSLGLEYREIGMDSKLVETNIQDLLQKNSTNLFLARPHLMKIY